LHDDREVEMARKATPTKVCTFTGDTLPATREFFYADKSQKDGLSPWSKQGEASYNKAYHAALKANGATRVRDLNDAQRAKFNKAMAVAKVRIARGKGKVVVAPANKARTNKARTSRAKVKA
jgi:hypothetical protein